MICESTLEPCIRDLRIEEKKHLLDQYVQLHVFELLKLETVPIKESTRAVNTEKTKKLKARVLKKN